MSPTEIDGFFEDIDLRASIALDAAHECLDSGELTEALTQMEKAEVSYPDQVEFMREQLENM